MPRRNSKHEDYYKKVKALNTKKLLTELTVSRQKNNKKERTTQKNRN